MTCGTSGWQLAQRQWEVREVDAEVASALERHFGLLPATARVLAGRGIDNVDEAEAFLLPSLDRLHSPFSFTQMDVAVDRLLRALEAEERIVVHGDYDVDGIAGTVVLVTVLRALGADVGFVVPHRMRDGYGLKPAGVDRAHELGARLLIAVDCGITAHAAAERAARLGIDLVIADHHQPEETVPPAAAVLNPRLPDAGYPESDLAAVAVAFKLARGVLQRHPAGFRATSLLKLVAIGTVADLVPLTGENRVITHYGLSTLLEAVNPGLRALLEVSGIRRSPVSAADIAFRLAPRINAVGRLGDPQVAVEMFMTADPGLARRLASRLNRANSRRQQVEAEVLEAALQQEPGPEDSIVVAVGEGWHRGVIGIIAARLVERWGRPAAVITVEGEWAYGSARSIPGFNIVAALASAAELLDEYGGHEQAAGFQLPAGEVETVRGALSSTHTEQLDEATRRSSRLLCDAALTLDHSIRGLALELDRLAPFGVGNPRPRFLCCDLHLSEPARLLKEKHLKLRLDASEGVVEAVGWRQGGVVGLLGDRRRVDAVATLHVRRWGGRWEPQLELLELRPSEGV